MMAFGKHDHDARFRKLAHRIEELRRKDEATREHRLRITRQRVEGVRRLWDTCSAFVQRLNSFIDHDHIELTPSEAPDEVSEENQVQLLLNVRGRILLLEIRTPTNMVASENFKKPYILEGEVRFFNQALLEDERVEEHGLFFCPSEGAGGDWLYWNGRTYKSGHVDEGYLASLLEQII